MEIRQQKHSKQIRFAFRNDALDDSLEYSSSSRSFSIEHTEMSRDRQKLTERNLWLRDVGLLSANCCIVRCASQNAYVETQCCY